ncbi:MAG: alpha/beta hydrolase [Pseudomonadota bacterium]
MPRLRPSRVFSCFVFALVVSGCAGAYTPKPYELHRVVRGDRAPALVFINGNAATLAAWDPIEPTFSARGVRTVRTDRDGFGETPLGPRPYDVRDEVAALQKALRDEGVDGDKILVAHSYGGVIAAALAQADPDVLGVVLVDAVVPGEMTKAYTDEILATYRPQYDAVRAQAPAIAEAIIPVVEAFPETAEKLRDVTWREDVRLIDIRAERTTDSAAMYDASLAYHRRLVAAAPDERTLVIATDSGHQVMKDRPDVVIAAVETLLEDYGRSGRGRVADCRTGGRPPLEGPTLIDRRYKKAPRCVPREAFKAYGSTQSDV